MLATELSAAQEEAKRRMAKARAELAAVRAEAAARGHDLGSQLADAQTSARAKARPEALRCVVTPMKGLPIVSQVPFHVTWWYLISRGAMH
jgi:hypothetical protein